MGAELCWGARFSPHPPPGAGHRRGHRRMQAGDGGSEVLTLNSVPLWTQAGPC